MVPNNGIFIELIHAKLIWALVGSNIHYIFFDFIQERYLFDILIDINPLHDT